MLLEEAELAIKAAMDIISKYDMNDAAISTLAKDYAANEARVWVQRVEEAKAEQDKKAASFFVANAIYTKARTRAAPIFKAAADADARALKAADLLHAAEAEALVCRILFVSHLKKNSCQQSRFSFNQRMYQFF
jgi:hypothetical protein